MRRDVARQASGRLTGSLGVACKSCWQETAKKGSEKGVRFIYSRSFSEVNGPDPCCFSFCFEIGDYADKSNVNPWIVNSISAFSSEFVTRKTNDVLKKLSLRRVRLRMRIKIHDYHQ